MSGVSRALRAAGVVAATALSVSLAAGSASALPTKGGKQSVSGTITWSVTITKVDDSDPADLSRRPETFTTQQQHKLVVNAVRDPKFTRTYVFKRGKADYNYTLSQTRVTEDYTMGVLGCRSTTTENASGSGKVDLNPNLFGKYNSNKDVLVIDRRTKGISVGAVLPATGTATTKLEGFGNSPCEPGSYTDPVEETGSTSLNDSRNVCLPSGLKSTNGNRPLFGKWNNGKKRFDFACSKSFTNGPETTSIRVSGSLKYRK